ncbi:MAG TPA: DUF72 domain-containing protein [Bryobacteraceae bacterium]|nr:DUF72 domain-containing protein [Bryobacteraceae bacterium]
MAIPRLGLCGWNGSQGSYFNDFDCIEIQSTFYDPPGVHVARKWRSIAPPGFEFCIKAWQLITHTAASPTYRRLRSPIPENERDAVGSFRQTEPVWHAWQRTLDIARALDASVILFQCPKSFLPTSANLLNFTAFFRRVNRERFRLAWEPRGESWTEDLVRELCAEYDLIHCVDPFETTSVYGDIRYWRLHGRGSYSYRYTDADLAFLKKLLAKQPQPGYLMFNNFSSKADALRFRLL